MALGASLTPSTEPNGVGPINHDSSAGAVDDTAMQPPAANPTTPEKQATLDNQPAPASPHKVKKKPRWNLFAPVPVASTTPPTPRAQRTYSINNSLKSFTFVLFDDGASTGRVWCARDSVWREWPINVNHPPVPGEGFTTLPDVNFRDPALPASLQDGFLQQAHAGTLFSNTIQNLTWAASVLEDSGYELEVQRLHLARQPAQKSHLRTGTNPFMGCRYPDISATANEIMGHRIEPPRDLPGWLNVPPVLPSTIWRGSNFVRGKNNTLLIPKGWRDQFMEEAEWLEERFKSPWSDKRKNHRPRRPELGGSKGIAAVGQHAARDKDEGPNRTSHSSNEVQKYKEPAPSSHDISTTSTILDPETAVAKTPETASGAVSTNGTYLGTSTSIIIPAEKNSAPSTEAAQTNPNSATPDNHENSNIIPTEDNVPLADFPRLEQTHHNPVSTASKYRPLLPKPSLSGNVDTVSDSTAGSGTFQPTTNDATKAKSAVDSLQVAWQAARRTAEIGREPSTSFTPRATHVVPLGTNLNPSIPTLIASVASVATSSANPTVLTASMAASTNRLTVPAITNSKKRKQPAPGTGEPTIPYPSPRPTKKAKQDLLIASKNSISKAEAANTADSSSVNNANIHNQAKPAAVMNKVIANNAWGPLQPFVVS
ncbi:hypothetical protein VTI74DRAFT_11668 [Chaetomium olivicolor]